MNKFITSALVLLVLCLLVACSPRQAESIEATRPAATAVPVEPEALPTRTAEPTAAVAATGIPTVTGPADSDGLSAFIEQLQNAITNQNYTEMQAVMSDPMAIGAWRSEWRMYEPSQTIESFQNASLPSPLAVQFTHISDDEITNLIGQPPATMFGPEVHVVAALHSTGWGQSISDEAVLFVTEADGRYSWSGFLYTNGRFADASLGTVAAPVGLIYINWSNGLYQIQPDGQHRQLLDAQDVNIPNFRVAPDGRHVAYVNDEQRQLWIIDTATGEHQQYAGDITPSGYLQWGDKNTLFVGIWLDPSEGEGPNNGHIATLDVRTGALQILDEEHLSGGRPSYLWDYTWSAFDVFTGQDGILTGRLYHPDSGLQIFDHTTFAGNSGQAIINPSWSPDPNRIAWMTGDGERRVVQVFDIEEKTATTIFDWDPARFGALVPSPMWSPNGRSLALEVWANGPEGSGIWLLAADGSRQTLVDAEGRDPYWVNNDLLVYGVNGGPRLYDVASDMAFKMDLPEGSWVMGFTNPDDLTALPDVVTVENSPSATPATLPNPADLVTMVEQVASPDGRWQATLSQSEPILADDGEKFYTLLTVEDGTTTWTPIAEWRGYGLGYIFPAVYQWSVDGRYLYYTNRMLGDGCILFVNGTDLHRLDVTDGTVTTVLDSGLTWNLALSPDETTVAYTQFNGQGMVVYLHNIAGDQDQSVTVAEGSDLQAGNLFWSPDGSQLLLTVANDPCSDGWMHSIVRVNVAGLTAVTLLENDPHRFTILEWADTAGTTVRLKDKDGSTWLLDVNSGNLTAE